MNRVPICNFLAMQLIAQFLILLLEIMLCSKLHCQKGFDSILFSDENGVRIIRIVTAESRHECKVASRSAEPPPQSANKSNINPKPANKSNISSYKLKIKFGIVVQI